MLLIVALKRLQSKKTRITRWWRNARRNIGNKKEIFGWSIHLRISNRNKVSCLLTTFQHYFVYTSWYFLPSYSRLLFSYPTFIKLILLLSYMFVLLSFARELLLPVFLYRKRWKENSSKRFFIGFCTEISNLGNYFTITAEGRNTCLIISSVGFFLLF